MYCNLAKCFNDAINVLYTGLLFFKFNKCVVYQPSVFVIIVLKCILMRYLVHLWSHIGHSFISSGGFDIDQVVVDIYLKLPSCLQNQYCRPLTIIINSAWYFRLHYPLFGLTKYQVQVIFAFEVSLKNHYRYLLETSHVLDKNLSSLDKSHNSFMHFD